MLIDSGLPLRCADSLALDGETHTDDGPGGLGPGPGLGPAPARMHSEPVDVVSGVTPFSSCGHRSRDASPFDRCEESAGRQDSSSSSGACHQNTSELAASGELAASRQPCPTNCPSSE